MTATSIIHDVGFTSLYCVLYPDNSLSDRRRLSPPNVKDIRKIPEAIVSQPLCVYLFSIIFDVEVLQNIAVNLEVMLFKRKNRSLCFVLNTSIVLMYCPR